MPGIKAVFKLGSYSLMRLVFQMRPLAGLFVIGKLVQGMAASIT